jgi:hypothetical protein
MNRLIISTICLCFFYACKAQQDVPPPIEKIELVTDKGIQYKFPDGIESALNKAIEKEENDLHLIWLKTINDSTYTLVMYSLSRAKDGVMSTNKLIKKTGRYYQYKNKQIPIIFDADYAFSTPGFVITDGGYWITFRFKNNKGIILQEE